jgi:transcriptional regulator with XRE-family HTH domain
MDTLGKTLKSTRENGISNAYLSQLENDKIKKPSASILYKLANVYKIDLNVLLYASGIIEKKDLTEVKPKQSLLEREIAFYKDKLSEDEEKEVLDFIKFLRYKKNNDVTL